MNSWVLFLLFAAIHPAPTDYRTLWARNLHTGEEVRVRPFAQHGLLRRTDAHRLTRLFRSWRTGRRRALHPRLVVVLVQVQRHFRGRRIDLVSGYRVPEHERALRSYHQVARAADIRIPGVVNREVYDFCRTFANVGCGLYPNAHHVHIDVRSQAAIWVDLSRDREPAAYVAHPEDWVDQHPNAGRR